MSFFVKGVSGVAHTLIKRSRISAARPRVRKDDLLRGVRDGCREFATLEERNVETQVEHVLKTVVDVNSTVVEKCCRGSVPGERKKKSNLTGNRLSIRGHTYGTCRRRLIAARTTSHTSSTQRSATSMDPSSTILERSWCLCKDSLCQKRNGINDAVLHTVRGTPGRCRALP